MLKSYLKIAFRNLIRHKAFSILNISGLAIGMACSILILLWVQNELSYDKFHINANQIYRLIDDASGFKAAVTPPGMAPALQKEMPEIQSVVRITRPMTKVLEVAERKFEEKQVICVDSNFLQLFSFKLIKGNSAIALQRPDGILITENMATKYFGTEDPLGKVIRQNNKDNLTVTGVLANCPPNSHLQFDFVQPMSSLMATDNSLRNESWRDFILYSYIQLNKNSTASPDLIHRINKIFKTHPTDIEVKFSLQPLTSIHLAPALQIDLPGHGNSQYVNIFFIVALFILGVACINFMNLSTARSTRRAKEVGLRKVVGAERSQLIIQFLGESLIITLFSLLVAISLVYAILPAFNTMSEKPLSLHLSDSSLLLKLLLIALATGLISGSYPALFLSGFKPISVLKGKLTISGNDLLFRNGLVLVQFAVSIILLTGTAAVYQQLNYIKDKNLGFDKSNLLYMRMTGDIRKNPTAFVNALKANAATSDFTLVSELPSNIISGGVDFEWEGKDPKNQVVIPSMAIDENFDDVFQVKMLSGRSISAGYNDTLNYVVNETAAHLMGFTATTAIGKSLIWDGDKGTIIGVVKDFNFKPLQNVIEPLVLGLRTSPTGIAVIRTKPNGNASSIAALESISRNLNPSNPFSYNFFDKDLDNQYRGEQQMGKIFNFFAVLAIFISFLGLYGLSAFTAEQRTKEIGVRKVLGASVFSIVYLLSSNFTRLIFLSIVIAVPVSWYAIDSWLQSYAYRIDISWTIFFGASCTALLIAWLTVSYESVKAAVVNPIKSLRSE
jgi:putative ABC transport system permease protein